MRRLALDVDGVLLDSDRSGKGHWSNELSIQLGIDAAQMRDAFFRPSWDDIVNGRRSIEDGLAEALALIGTTADVESVLSCWFDADYVPFEATLDLARRASQAGCRVVLATNQEHRRATYLRRRLNAAVPIEDMFYSADIGCQKHDQRFFEVASQRLGISASDWSDIVFVDDTRKNVEAAQAFGWQAVHACDGALWIQEVEQLLGLTASASEH